MIDLRKAGNRLWKDTENDDVEDVEGGEVT